MDKICVGLYCDWCFGAAYTFYIMNRGSNSLKEKILKFEHELSEIRQSLIIPKPTASSAYEPIVGSRYFGATLSDRKLVDKERNGVWPDHVSIRINRTFGYLFGSTCLTAFVTCLLYRNNTFTFWFLVDKRGVKLFSSFLAINLFSIYICRKVPYQDGYYYVKHIALVVNCACNALIVSPLCIVFGTDMLQASFYSFGLLASLSVVCSFVPHKKFFNWAAPTSMILGGLTLLSIDKFVLQLADDCSMVDSIILFGEIITFSGCIMLNADVLVGRVAELKPEDSFDPINVNMVQFVMVKLIYDLRDVLVHLVGKKNS